MPPERQDPSAPTLPMPPHTRTAKGRTRRVGVEIELGHLSLERTVALVSAHLAEWPGGGARTEVRAQGRYEHQVLGDPAGPWSVEIDAAWLKALGRRPRHPDDPLAPLHEAGEDLARSAAELVAPVEIVGPPLPLERLGEVDALIERLRRAGALGTGGRLVYAFGLQLNPELPGTDEQTIRRYLQSFLCLYDWLRRRAHIDIARRMTSFIEPFDKHYVRKVVDSRYRPALPRLIDDYLAANPTRNRALDCLPLFMHLDAQRVRRAVPDPRIKARPALHYRLPNSEIDRPGWGLRPVWEDWLQVEHLAADPERLAECCRVYADFIDRPLAHLAEDWADWASRWTKPAADL